MKQEDRYQCGKAILVRLNCKCCSWKQSRFIKWAHLTFNKTQTTPSREKNLHKVQDPDIQTESTILHRHHKIPSTLLYLFSKYSSQEHRIPWKRGSKNSKSTIILQAPYPTDQIKGMNKKYQIKGMNKKSFIIQDTTKTETKTTELTLIESPGRNRSTQAKTEARSKTLH